MTDPEFQEAVLAGLSRRQRGIPCRFLYDYAGSALFERITTAEGYYLTRAETALLAASVEAVAAMVGPASRVVEPGPGSMRKTRLLLAALDRPAGYAPIDVAEDVVSGAEALARDFPGLSTAPMVADFTRSFRLPPLPGNGPIVVFFPGSTIGNLTPFQAVRFLRRMGRVAGRGGWVLVGVDPVRDPARLRAAYDDDGGLTAAFMRNVLLRANRELGAGFDAEAFDHSVRWSSAKNRVEHRLVCRKDQTVSVAGREFPIRQGEAIHVENCHKYPPEAFRRLAVRAGLGVSATWMHAEGLFSLHLMRPVAVSPPAAHQGGPSAGAP